MQPESTEHHAPHSAKHSPASSAHNPHHNSHYYPQKPTQSYYPASSPKDHNMQEDSELLDPDSVNNELIKGWGIPPHAVLPSGRSLNVNKRREQQREATEAMHETDDTIRIKFDTNDQASMVNAITQLGKEATAIQLAALVVFEAERTARAERYAKMLELLLLVVGAILGGALAVSVYYNIN
jgi:hypothetical protein